jgi:hypothetical protein
MLIWALPEGSDYCLVPLFFGDSGILRLMFSFIKFEQDKAIIEKYDRKTFHHLHP